MQAVDVTEQIFIVVKQISQQLDYTLLVIRILQLCDAGERILVTTFFIS